jgi:hypothetical protein
MAGRTAADLAFWRNLSAAVFGVFAAAAGIAQALEAPLPVRLAFAVVSALGAVVALVLAWMERQVEKREIRAAEEAEQEKQEAARDARLSLSTAVVISVARDERQTWLWVLNNGPYFVRDVEITAAPAELDWKPSTHGRLPGVHPLVSPGMTLDPTIRGPGWFRASLDQINSKAGSSIARFDHDSSTYQRIHIDVRWNDHEGRRRGRWGVADLREVQGTFPMREAEAEAEST